MSTTLVAALALACASDGVACKVNGVAFTARSYELLKFSKPDTASNGQGVTDRAAKYELTIEDGKNSLKLVFATDWGKPIDNLKIVWRPTKFGTDEHRAQAYPRKGGGVGRGLYAVFISIDDKSDIVSDEVAMALVFGKMQGGKIGFSIDMRLPGGGTVRGSGIAPIHTL